MYPEKLRKKSPSGVISGALKFHLKKTIAVVFSHRKDLDIQLSINNQKVKVVSK